jgi:hypothetical protein
MNPGFFMKTVAAVYDRRMKTFQKQSGSHIQPLQKI